MESIGAPPLATELREQAKKRQKPIAAPSAIMAPVSRCTQEGIPPLRPGVPRRQFGPRRILDCSPRFAVTRGSSCTHPSAARCAKPLPLGRTKIERFRLDMGDQVRQVVESGRKQLQRNLAWVGCFILIFASRSAQPQALSADLLHNRCLCRSGTGYGGAAAAGTPPLRGSASHLFGRLDTRLRVSSSDRVGDRFDVIVRSQHAGAVQIFLKITSGDTMAAVLMPPRH